MMILLLLWGIAGAIAFGPQNKDYLSGLIMKELANQLGKESDMSYLDMNDPILSLGERSLEEEQYYPMDYDVGGDMPLHPMTRDQEYLQQSSLWGSQYVSGGAGEGQQHLRPAGSFLNRQEIKSDATLPAYCNPPNPCPVGYEEEEGCVEEFENTASFSRRYQSLQECMCDSEHMFECPSISTYDRDEIDNYEDMDFNRFLQHHIKSMYENPFLTGDRLPVAAKKGHSVF